MPFARTHSTSSQPAAIMSSTARTCAWGDSGRSRRREDRLREDALDVLATRGDHELDGAYMRLGKIGEDPTCRVLAARWRVRISTDAHAQPRELAVAELLLD